MPLIPFRNNPDESDDKEKEDNYRATDDYSPEEIDLSTYEDEEENDK